VKGEEKEMRTIRPRSLRKDKKAVSPAISTVIMIAAVMVLIFVAMSYANTVLDTRLAENEFSANQQFMVSTGLQIDDVAWTVGRTQTISYASRYGSVKYQPLALNYSVELHSTTTGWESVSQLSNLTTGMIMYNMPISDYNMGNNYFARVEPRNEASFLQSGATAPVSQVFVVEQLPMDDGNFIRVVAVPSIRTLDSSITSGSGSTIYYKFFLPILNASSENPALSQSVTMLGDNVNKTTLKLGSNVDSVRVTVDFPSAESGFNLGFFGWNEEDRTVETPVEPNSVVEFYVGMVNVSIGLP
jgi:hypothetical protein